MKLLYYASYVLSAPFYAIAWVLYALSEVFDYVGNAIFAATTYRIWDAGQKTQEAALLEDEQ